MDLVASCKEKLTYFRIRELKMVLNHLGLSKQGKKQDLVDRILALLSNEQGLWVKKNAVGKDDVAKIVDDTYRKMQGSGAADLASKSQGDSDSTNVKLNEETADSCQRDKIRCLCGGTLPTDSMIKCEDPKCNTWQHIPCVLIPEKPTEDIVPNPPDIFYCEICRLSRADPFWDTIAHQLYPVKLNITNVPADGSNPGLSIERTFQLSRSDKELLSKQDYDVQVWCMLVNDKVTFRMQWPQYADLQVNGAPVRAINRPGSQLLGFNGRDDGPIITPFTRDGINKVSLTGCDARIFCVGVRIVRRRTVHQILSMIPKESDGEVFEDALARVRRCVGGGADTENADSDSEIEVVSDSIPVNLRCPMSGLRMKVAGRFKPCAHMGCFDLEVFVEINQRTRKWQCPICLKNYSWEKIIIDPYFNQIALKLRKFGEEVAEIEVKPDGSWRAKSEGDRKGLGELGLWHFPDGTICPSVDWESKPKPEISAKQEACSNSHAALKLGIRKNQNGCWEFNKPNDLRGISPANIFQEDLENNGHNIIPMSSSATASGRDGEDASVNQGGGGNRDFPIINDLEYDSISLNANPTAPAFDTAAAPAADAELIVLSDSDDEIDPIMSSGTAFPNNGSDAGGVRYSAPLLPGMSDPYFENPPLPNGGNSFLDLYSTNDDDFGSNMWPSPSGGQGVSSFQLFGSDADVPDPLFGMPHTTLNCSSSVNGLTATADIPMGSAMHAPELIDQHSNMNDGLVDNSLAYTGNDPSLQIFLPTRPSDVLPSQSDLRDQPEMSNGIHTEDWISLRLGDGGGGQGGSSAPNELVSGHELPSVDDDLDSPADQAAFLPGANENKKARSRETSDGPFSFPRQRRSVRPRLYLSIDSESE
ncbi:E3 SUMO-protein ligase SIZ1-like isoform X2 [Andrographis paniculata]|uniref:E3 SUMO-protein ligase SIZ1-like isoform X2 n=1 Tax=Andrographis paniculata TaxID=175694 RepID=UPI0021E7305C|nr:E3 SUMO-protein ligase SIZ1-like isoform X2 [Andrographis paniculata]